MLDKTACREYADLLIESILRLETYELVPWEQLAAPASAGEPASAGYALFGSREPFTSLLPAEQGTFLAWYGEFAAARHPGASHVLVLRYEYGTYVVRLCSRAEYRWVHEFERDCVVAVRHLGATGPAERELAQSESQH